MCGGTYSTCAVSVCECVFMVVCICRSACERVYLWEYVCVGVCMCGRVYVEACVAVHAV